VSIYLGSPIWLTKAPIDPGFGFEIRNGLKLGVLVPEFAIGFQWNWFNVNKVREQFPEFNQPQTLSGEDIAGTWLNLGLRFEPEVHAKFQPYVSLGFDAILWGFSFDRESYCGWWSCGTVRNYEFAPGFSSRIGFRYSPQPFFGLDLGVRPAMSFEGWAFEKTQVWLEPYAGITLSLDAARRR
jgi:hypothetical protein